MEKWVVRNARIVNSERTFRGDLSVDNGIITGVGPDLGGDLGREFDAEGMRLIPGLIDPHVHFELPVGDRVSSDDFDVGSIAALHGGVTTVMDFTTPVPGRSLDESLDERLERCRKSRADISLHNTVCGWNPMIETSAETCIERGFNSFKFFTAYEESGRRTQYGELLKAAEFCRNHSAVMLIHAEDQNLLNPPLSGASDSFLTYSDSRPESAEVAAVHQLSEIQKATGATIYIVHLSSRAGLDAAHNSDLLLETCPHYLSIQNNVYLEPYGYRYAVAPPLRREDSLKGLWAAISNGRIKTIGTDHCPFPVAEQDDAGDHFTRTPYGLAGVETLLPVMVTYGIERNRLTWEQLVQVTSENAARIFGLFPRKGSLSPGADADFVLIGNTFQTVEPAILHSNAMWNPYTGFLLTGWPHTVVSRGDVVVLDGQLLRESGHGKVLTRFSS